MGGCSHIRRHVPARTGPRASPPFTNHFPRLSGPPHMCRTASADRKLPRDATPRPSAVPRRERPAVGARDGPPGLRRVPGRPGTGGAGSRGKGSTAASSPPPRTLPAVTVPLLSVPADDRGCPPGPARTATGRTRTGTATKCGGSCPRGRAFRPRRAAQGDCRVPPDRGAPVRSRSRHRPGDRHSRGLCGCTVARLCGVPGSGPGHSPVHRNGAGGTGTLRSPKRVRHNHPGPTSRPLRGTKHYRPGPVPGHLRRGFNVATQPEHGPRCTGRNRKHNNSTAPAEVRFRTDATEGHGKDAPEKHEQGTEVLSFGGFRLFKGVGRAGLEPATQGL